MRFWTRAFSFLIAAAAPVSACSSSEEVLANQKACEANVKILCNRLAECSPYFLTHSYTDLAECVTLRTADCTALSTLPRTGITPSYIEACARGYEMQSCAEVAPGGSAPEACFPVKGGIENGAACSDDSQCASAFCAVNSEDGWCGTCQVDPKAGEPCVNGACNHWKGLHCFDGRCKAYGKEGAACSDEKAPCLPSTLQCIGTGDSGGATCQLGNGQNQPCQVGGPTCDFSKGLSCDYKAKKCLPIVDVAAGGTCGATLGETSLVLCQHGAFCNNTRAMPQGRCVELSKAGAPCSETQPCATELRCQKGVCVDRANAKCP